MPQGAFFYLVLGLLSRTGQIEAEKTLAIEKTPQNGTNEGLMVDTTARRRTSDCRVKLDPKMLERLETIAVSNGFPVATMAAVAIAEWVNLKEQAARNQQMAILDFARRSGGQMEDIFKAILSDPDAMQVINSMGDAAIRKAAGGEETEPRQDKGR